MVQVYCYDEKGYFTTSKVISEKDMDINMTTIMVEGFYKPKFEGGAWIEGATQEEIEVINQSQPRETSREDKITILIEENNRLWDTVEFLLKQNGNIPGEDVIA